MKRIMISLAAIIMIAVSVAFTSDKKAVAAVSTGSCCTEQSCICGSNCACTPSADGTTCVCTGCPDMPDCVCPQASCANAAVTAVAKQAVAGKESCCTNTPDCCK